jgi:hypothetical protein
LCADIHLNLNTCKKQGISNKMLPFDVFVKKLMITSTDTIDFFIEDALDKAIEKNNNKNYYYIDDNNNTGIKLIKKSFLKYLNAYPKIKLNKSRIHYIDIRNNFFLLGEIFYIHKYDYRKAYEHIFNMKHNSIIGLIKLNKQINNSSDKVKKALLGFLYDESKKIHDQFLNMKPLQDDNDYIILAPELKTKYGFTKINYMLVLNYTVLLMDIYSFARMLKPQLHIKKAIFYTGYSHTLNAAMFFIKYLNAKVIYGDYNDFITIYNQIIKKLIINDNNINQCHKLIPEEYTDLLRRFL